MARCSNCNYKWKVKDVWKLTISKKGKACPNCNTRQFASFKDRGLLLGLGYLSGTNAQQ
jgi:CXXC-20-CXXC protein